MKKTKNGINDKPILYYIGDLPSHRIDGITTSFSINLKILAEKFTIHHVAENRMLREGVFAKIGKIANFFVRTQRGYSTNPPDVVYTNFALSFWGSLKTLFILMLSKSYGASIILHLHRGDFHNDYLNKCFNRFIAKRIVESAHRIIVLSERLKHKLSKNYGEPKFYTIHNTIEEEVSIVNSIKSWPRAEETQFLFLSNYLKSKGIFDLLSVFKEIEKEYTNVVLNCYGIIPDRKTKKTLESHSSARRRINGAVKGIEKFKIIQGSSCLILPSWTEGQPLVILEAMSQAVPVIASDVGNISEMLGKGYPFLFKPKNRSNLEQIIRKFLTRNNNEDIGKALMERYFKYYSQEKHRDKLLALFDQFSK